MRKHNVKRTTNKQVVPPKAEPPANQRKLPSRYMLTMLREGGFYSPMTDQEFEDFKRNNPQLAQYFETDEEGGDLVGIDKL